VTRISHRTRALAVRGFTLIELIVVMSLIILLATIGLMRISRA
jgi:prepilin-type N-terminal cleavage/methylation domain-containing protein